MCLAKLGFNLGEISHDHFIAQDFSIFTEEGTDTEGVIGNHDYL